MRGPNRSRGRPLRAPQHPPSLAPLTQAPHSLALQGEQQRMERSTSLETNPVTHPSQTNPSPGLSNADRNRHKGKLLPSEYALVRSRQQVVQAHHNSTTTELRGDGIAARPRLSRRSRRQWLRAKRARVPAGRLRPLTTPLRRGAERGAIPPQNKLGECTCLSQRATRRRYAQ